MSLEFFDPSQINGDSIPPIPQSHRFIDSLTQEITDEKLGLFSNEFISGVNYGNRFIPEPWMANSQESIYNTKYGPSIDKPDYVDDLSLCDISDDRILRYLEDKVKEEHF